MTDDVTNRLRGIRKQYFPHPPCGGVFADYCNCDDCQERPVIVEYQDLKFLLDELEHLRERDELRQQLDDLKSGYNR